MLSTRPSRFRLSARAARSSPPRRDGAYWHCLATSRHRLHCGRVASHFRWRERHGRQAREERVAPRGCDVAVLIAFMGVELIDKLDTVQGLSWRLIAGVLVREKEIRNMPVRLFGYPMRAYMVGIRCTTVSTRPHRKLIVLACRYFLSCP